MALSSYLRQRRSKQPVLLMTHVVCGYPSFDDNFRELEIMARHGVDLVELQFPFSEPSADGPLFVKANQMSIANGTSVDQCFEFMTKVSREFDFKTLMMGYYNTAFRMGEELFLQRLADAGACGYILPDLPLEEAGPLHQLSRQHGLAPIMLMTPTSSNSRLQQIAEVADGFVYAVARKGVTGNQTEMNTDVAEFIARCRSATDLPLAVGFGVSSREDVDFIGSHADIAIIGTAALRAWESGGETALNDFFSAITATRT